MPFLTKRAFIDMQDSLITERAQKTALEHMLQEEKDLMESVVRREMEKAASLQVDLATARQQKALSTHPMHCGCTSICCCVSPCPPRPSGKACFIPSILHAGLAVLHQ